MKEKIMPWGARIETGVVREVTDEGCRVESLERAGVVTMPLKPLFAETLTVGDIVHFFTWEDGTGRILYTRTGTPAPVPEEMTPITNTEIDTICDG